MKKHELLIPVGNMSCLKQAVLNGADAVYLAGRKFGARKFAVNFTNEELVDAISYCHLYGVRVYVTMNTLIHDNEVESFLEQIRFLHKIGVDAVIVQDLGMIYLIRQKFPNLEVHASTQANNSSIDTCRMLYDLGVKRVVLSRELSIEEINNIDVDIEKEVFIHGALCVSYSGCCLMSSMNGGRSGNRGECAGSCRLPYSLTKDNKLIKKDSYLLSMKELNASCHIKELLNSNIDSFKIEGRMKGALYVGFITRFYRRLIDGEKFDFNSETDKLKTIFNREFTDGHLFGVKDSDLINEKTPNHIGLEIGKAILEKNRIKLILSPGKSIQQFDSIRFLNSNKGMVINYLYDKNNKLCNSSSDICYVDNKVSLTHDDVLSKTNDYLLEKEYNMDTIQRKIPISFKVIAKTGECLVITISDGINSITEKTGRVEEAKTIPTSLDSIKEKLSKVGNSPFIVHNIDVEIDGNSFIQIKMINELKRLLIDKLIEERQKTKTLFVERDFSFVKSTSKEFGRSYTCRVYNEEQLKMCLDLPFKRIYVSSLDVYEKYKSNERVMFSLERSFYKNNYNEGFVSDCFNFKSGNFYGSYGLNVTNIYTAYYLQLLGLKNIPLSVELTNDEVVSIINHYKEECGSALFEIMGYGRVENMIIKGNILNINSNEEYKLIDSKGRVFPVFFDGKKTHIYHSDIRFNNYPQLDVNLFFDFIDESGEQIRDVVTKFTVKNNC